MPEEKLTLEDFEKLRNASRVNTSGSASNLLLCLDEMAQSLQLTHMIGTSHLKDAGAAKAIAMGRSLRPLLDPLLHENLGISSVDKFPPREKFVQALHDAYAMFDSEQQDDPSGNLNLGKWSANVIDASLMALGMPPVKNLAPQEIVAPPPPANDPNPEGTINIPGPHHRNGPLGQNGHAH